MRSREVAGRLLTGHSDLADAPVRVAVRDGAELRIWPLDTDANGEPMRRQVLPGIDVDAAGLEALYIDSVSEFDWRFLIHFSTSGPRLVSATIESRDADIRQPDKSPSVSTAALRTMPLSRVVGAIVEIYITWAGGRVPALRLSDSIAATIDESRPWRHLSYDERVARVATKYRAAIAAGSTSPTQDVARELLLHRSHVARLVSAARQPPFNLLGPARAGRGGEALPAAQAPKANRSRRSPHGKRRSST